MDTDARGRVCTSGTRKDRTGCPTPDTHPPRQQALWVQRVSESEHTKTSDDSDLTDS